MPKVAASEPESQPDHQSQGLVVVEAAFFQGRPLAPGHVFFTDPEDPEKQLRVGPGTGAVTVLASEAQKHLDSGRLRLHQPEVTAD